MMIIFGIGIALFVASSIYFWLTSKNGFNSAFFVSFVTLISYIIMMQGNWLIGSQETGLYYTRWVFYGISCALLTYEISKQLKISTASMLNAVALTPIVMVTGALASVYSGDYKWVMFGVSCTAFALIGSLYLTSNSPQLNRIKLYFLLGWTVFPIVFLLSPEGLGFINNLYAASVYLVLDFGTKIVFYLHHRSIKNTVS